MSVEQAGTMIDSADPEYLSTEDGQFLLWAHRQYLRELDIQRHNLHERAKDADFYDGDQFSQEDLSIYEARGQEARVFNETKPTIDWILGSERRARSDWNVLPRTEDDVEPALVKTKLIKYIDDINKARYQRSRAFEDEVKTGEGWTRVAVEPNEDGDPQPTLRYEHWRNMLRDSTCRDTIGLTDCKYIWCTKPVDLDSLIAWFPDKKSALTNSIGDFEDMLIEQGDEMHDAGRQRQQTDGSVITHSGSMSIDRQGNGNAERPAVRVWEMWYRKSERVKVLRKAGGLSGEIYNPNDDLHKHLVDTGEATVKETVREQMYMAMYTETTVLYHGKSIYAHNRYPFVCRTAFIKDRDGTVYGVIRQIRDPQSDLNTRRNKALFLMSTNRVIMDDGAVEDENELACEVAKPDSIIKKKKGFDFQLQEGAVLAPQHIAMSEQDSAYIRQVAGVTGENRGMDSTAKSGIAIQSLQEQGTVITTALIDNHSLAHQNEGELLLSVCEQFIDREMQFRISGDDINDKEFVSINSGEPETNITAAQADFVVSERDYRQTMRQALSEQMLQVASQITQSTGDPMMAIAMIEMAIDLQDLPNKMQITAALRKAAGLPPRDETEDQRIAREEQQQQQQAMQQKIQEQQQQTMLRLESAKADEMEAKAKERMAEAEREMANAISHKVDAVTSAIEAAELVRTRPDLAPIVDDLLGSLDGVLHRPKINESPPSNPVPNDPPSAGFSLPENVQE